MRNVVVIIVGVCGVHADTVCSGVGHVQRGETFKSCKCVCGKGSRVGHFNGRERFGDEVVVRFVEITLFGVGIDDIFRAEQIAEGAVAHRAVRVPDEGDLHALKRNAVCKRFFADVRYGVGEGDRREFLAAAERFVADVVDGGRNGHARERFTAVKETLGNFCNAFVERYGFEFKAVCKCVCAQRLETIGNHHFGERFAVVECAIADATALHIHFRGKGYGCKVGAVGKRLVADCEGKRVGVLLFKVYGRERFTAIERLFGDTFDDDRIAFERNLGFQILYRKGFGNSVVARYVHLVALVAFEVNDGRVVCKVGDVVQRFDVRNFTNFASCLVILFFGHGVFVFVNDYVALFEAAAGRRRSIVLVASGKQSRR